MFSNCDTAVSRRFLERLGLVSVLKIERLVSSPGMLVLGYKVYLCLDVSLRTLGKSLALALTKKLKSLALALVMKAKSLALALDLA